MEAPSFRKPRFLVRLRRTCRRLGFFVLLLAAALVAVKYWGYDKLDDEVRARVEQRLREQFPQLVVKVRSARRVQGKGIEVRGIRLSEPGNGKPRELVYIDECLADCDTHFPDFVLEAPLVRHLRIRGLKLRAERHADGTWSLAQLMAGSNHPRLAWPPITLEEGELEIVDPARGSLSLRKINLTLAPQTVRGSPSATGSQQLWQLRGTLAGDYLERIEVQGLLDPANGQWEVRGAVEGLEFNPRLRAALPREAGDALAPLASIRGRTQFGFRVASGRPPGAAAAGLPALQFEADGQISEGRVDDARLPDPLTDVVATIHLDNRSLRIDDLSARCGQTIIQSLSAEWHGLAPGSPLTISLDARQVVLQRLPVQSFPSGVRQAWAKFAPQGTVNLVGTLHFDGRKWHPQLTAECLDLSVEYDRFKYRVTDGVGTIKLEYDKLTADVRFLAGSQTVRCLCNVQQPGKNFTGTIDIRSGGPLQIDADMLAALDPKHQQVVQSFHPRGSIRFAARFGRQRTDDIVHREINIELSQLTIQYDKFRYPIDRITGTLKLDDDQWTFANLAGRNDSAQIAGSGTWLARPDRDGTQLYLNFLATSVPLDDELRLALVPGAQRLWTNLRPRGTLDELKVRLRYGGTGSGLAVEVDASKRSGSPTSPISLEPTCFRYKLDEVTGDFTYDSRSGVATLSAVRARHEQTTVQAAGACRINQDGSCGLRLTRLVADRIHPDHVLWSALPGGIGQALARLELAGQFNMQGELGIVVPPEGALAADAPPALDWNLRFDVENGSLKAGLPVEHIHGQVQLTGQSDGKTLVSRGQLEIDSAMVRGVQLTQIRGPLLIDSQRLLAGTWAERNVHGRIPHWITANLVGGQLSLDGELLFADGQFQLQATLENGDLAAVMQQLSPAQRNLSGKVFSVVNVGGTTQGVHTWRGQGEVRLKDADIYELPVMVALLKLLAIQRPDRTAFTTSNMNFRIEGDDIELTQIDFEGDAITLKGKGWMNNRQEIDLKFYTQLGRDEMQLPLFRPVLGELNRQFLLIEVTGRLDRPHVTKTAFPGLNEQLSQMFPELAARAEMRQMDPAREGWWGQRKLLPRSLWLRKE